MGRPTARRYLSESDRQALKQLITGVQREIANALGISNSMLSLQLHGQRTVPDDFMVQCVRALSKLRQQQDKRKVS